MALEPAFSPQLGPFAPFFDWYRTTLPVHPSDLYEIIEERFPTADRRPAPSIPRFSPDVEYCDAAGNRIAALYLASDGQSAHAIASGHHCDAVVPLLRSFSHKPSRLDVALDVGGDGLFASLDAVSRRVAANFSLTRTTIFPDDPVLGSTIYLGSRTSQFFMRIYQPGLLRAKVELLHPDQIAAIDRDAVRIELEVKPATPALKADFSIKPAADVFRSCSWAAALLRVALALDVSPIKLRPPQRASRDVALRHMARQYSAHLTSLMAEHHGDLSAFASVIWQYSQDDQKQKHLPKLAG